MTVARQRIRRNRINHRAAIGIAGLIGLALWGGVPGCQPHEAQNPKEKILTPEGQGASRRIAFGDLPEPVRTAFARQHPKGRVTDSGVQVTPTGLTMYRIVYKSDKMEAEANYDAEGNAVTSEMANIATKPPGALPPPSTAPANITAPRTPEPRAPTTVPY